MDIINIRMNELPTSCNVNQNAKCRQRIQYTHTLYHFACDIHLINIHYKGVDKTNHRDYNMQYYYCRWQFNLGRVCQTIPSQPSIP